MSEHGSESMGDNERLGDELMRDIEYVRTIRGEGVNDRRIDAIYDFNQELEETFGRKTLQCIPAWHKLVGSTVEEHPMDESTRRTIDRRIRKFVDHLLKEFKEIERE